MNINSYCEPQVIKGPLNIFLFRLPIIFYSYINRFKRKLLFDVWSISNRHPADGDYFRVLFFGENKTDKNYFCNLIFNEKYDEIYLGKVWIWRILFYLWGSQKNYDLLIIKSRMKLCNLFKSKSNYVIPAWVSCELDLCCDIGSQSMSKKSFKNVG